MESLLNFCQKWPSNEKKFKRKEENLDFSLLNTIVCYQIWLQSFTNIWTRYYSEKLVTTKNTAFPKKYFFYLKSPFSKLNWPVWGNGWCMAQILQIMCKTTLSQQTLTFAPKPTLGMSKLVFCYQHWKGFEIWGWRPRICKIFEIPRTIYSNSERSEQFLVTECFFNLFREVSHIW